MTIHSHHESAHARKHPHNGPPQADPGDKNYVQYALTFTPHSGSNSYGYVISTSTTDYRTTVSGQAYVLAQSTEYYNIAAMLSALRAASAGSSLTWSPGSSLYWPSSGAITNFDNVYVATATQPVSNLTWTRDSTPSSALSNGSTMAVAFTNLSYSTDSHTFSGSIDWWSLGANAPTTSLIVSSATTTLNYGSAPAAGGGNSWWHASASVSSIYLP
jgi:hypothetical protein